MPVTHTCPTCGYKWEQGHSGNHLCSVFLKERIRKLEIEVAESPNTRMSYSQTNFGIDHSKLEDVYEKAFSMATQDGNASSRSIAILAMELILIEYRDAIVKRLESQF